MSFSIAFSVFVMVATAALLLRKRNQEVTRIQSDIDGRSYLVLRLPDMQAAADQLALINKACQDLIHHMRSAFDNSDCVKRLAEKYNPDAFSEGSPNSGYATSYSVNKGERIVVCLRQTDNTLVDLNILLYVVFHELAHLMTKSIGHTNEFWTNFKFLLREALAEGLDIKTDYAAHPEAYCGIQISQTL